MSVLLLVRHGQASFGKRDYDALSKRGHEQARILGAALAARGVTPDFVIAGSMKRHRQTAAGILEGLGIELPVVEDAGWNEFDFEHVMQVFKPLYRSKALMYADFARMPAKERRVRFQALFEEATGRWTSGNSDADYRESFPAFAERVGEALRRSGERARETGTALVVSSGGPIGLAASQLLAGTPELWPQLNRVAVNTAVTKVIAGRSGLTLSSFNDHAHLESDPELLTYR